MYSLNFLLIITTNKVYEIEPYDNIFWDFPHILYHLKKVPAPSPQLRIMLATYPVHTSM